ncbi:hypothetical protein F5Y08DRAFT_342418 [Xylaria arbuscula]|nr:hypothetical protein F5Y08DRAFT_342418 [Xylaria arbuscula]
MIPFAIKQALGRNTITREDLIKLSNRLDAAYNCVAHFEALEEKRGYDIGKQFPVDLYKSGTQKLLLDHWLSNEPDTCILDGDGYNFDAGLAGCEWAAFLRVRDPSAVVLHVYPKDRTGRMEHVLCQLLSSLIYNLASLVPERFEKTSSLCKRNFEVLAQGGRLGIDAGLGILESLPLLDLDGRKMLCIIQGLDRDGNGGIGDNGRPLMAVVEALLAQNNGRLLCTVAKRKSSLHSN